MTQEKLEQVYYLNNELEMWKERRKELHLSITTQAKVLDGMPVSKTNSVRKPVEDAAVRISSKLEKIDKKISKLMTKIELTKIQIEEFIITINDSKMRQILEYRCVQNLTWREIGKKMNYDYAWCRKKYIRFLKKL